ncbi:TetR/AcrR family transcriptional regulator [Actinokineospora sp.]|uniref:TetR/AcrR family transcriptional regulator n=1 Tax=Actinokineospora sp. TaxID=1872133 RepID=UPI003D6B567B
MTDLLAALPLRERKRARVRVGLWSHLVDRIEKTPFAEVSVKELAAAVEVSEPTFFSHFPNKADLLGYHICLWRIRMLLASAVAGEGREFLLRFFDETAKSIVDGPRMWFEITAEIARGGGLCAPQEISAAERLLAFGDPAALEIAVTPQADLFEHHLRVAGLADVPAAVTALLTGFYGVPLALGEGRLDQLADAYRDHVTRVV